MTVKSGVLFVCSHNSARSQMAEGLFRHAAGDRFGIASAGVEPGVLNPFAVQAMQEIGIDISQHTAESIDTYRGTWQVDHLVIVCDKAAAQCPTDWPGVGQTHHWFFEDPSAATGSDAEKLAVFRQVRDAIRRRLESWLEKPDDSESSQNAQV